MDSGCTILLHHQSSPAPQNHPASPAQTAPHLVAIIAANLPRQLLAAVGAHGAAQPHQGHLLGH